MTWRRTSKQTIKERSGCFENLALLFRTFLESMLPLGAVYGGCNLACSRLVLRTVGSPVRVLGGDHVGAGFRIVEGRIHDARRYPLGDRRFQRRVVLAAGECYQVMFAVRRVCAPTLCWLSTLPVVSNSGNLRLVRSFIAT